MAIVSDTDACQILGLDATDVLLPLVRGPAEDACKDYLGWDPERSAKTEYYARTERGGESFYWLGEWGSHSSIGGRTDVQPLKRPWVLASGLQVWEFSGAWMGQSDDTDWELLTLGDEYYLDLDDDNVSESGHLIRLGAEWPKQRGSVKVTYTAGFTPTELNGAMTEDTDYTRASAIRLAVMETIAKAYNEMKAQQKNPRTHAAGVLVGERVPDYGYTADGPATRLQQGMLIDVPPSAQRKLDRYSTNCRVMI